MMKKEWVELNQCGFFPGEDESEDHFYSRVEKEKKIYKAWNERLRNRVQTTDWEEANRYCFRLLGVTCEEILPFYANHKLHLWQGAQTVICDAEEGKELLSSCQAIQVPSLLDIPHDLMLCFLQLRQGFKKGSYLKIYTLKEVLSHEIVHASRRSLDQAIFEEFFAYRTSRYFWRKFFGPFFKEPQEAMLFCITLLCFGISALTAQFFDHPRLYLMLQAVPLVLCCYFFSRLLYRHVQFFCCRKVLEKILSNPSDALAVMLRMTDYEITLFARKTKSSAKHLIQQWMKNNFRWQWISAVYKSFLSEEER